MLYTLYRCLLVEFETFEGRSPDSFNGITPEEIRRKLLKRSSTARPMGLPGLCLIVPLPQETTGGVTFNEGPGSATGDSRVGAHTLWLQSNGKDE